MLLLAGARAGANLRTRSPFPFLSDRVWLGSQALANLNAAYQTACRPLQSERNGPTRYEGDLPPCAFFRDRLDRVPSAPRGGWARLSLAAWLLCLPCGQQQTVLGPAAPAPPHVPHPPTRATHQGRPGSRLPRSTPATVHRPPPAPLFSPPHFRPPTPLSHPSILTESLSAPCVSPSTAHLSPAVARFS